MLRNTYDLFRRFSQEIAACLWFHFKFSNSILRSYLRKKKKWKKFGGILIGYFHQFENFATLVTFCRIEIKKILIISSFKILEVSPFLTSLRNFLEQFA